MIKPQKDPMSWTSKALAASHTVSLDATSPAETVSMLVEFALPVARESARREALGRDPSLSDQSSVERRVLHDAQMRALACQVGFAAMAAGLPPSGEGFGAMKTFVGQMTPRGRRLALADLRNAAPDADWAAELDQACLAEGMDASKSKVLASAGSPPEPSPFEASFAHALAEARLKGTDEALMALERDSRWASSQNDRSETMSTAARGASSLGEMIADMKVLCAEREMSTGRDWRDSGQGFSPLFKNTRDSELRAMGQAYISLVDFSDVDPRSEASAPAALGAIASMMEHSNGSSFLLEVAEAAQMGRVRPEWRKIAEMEFEKNNSKWKVGIARPASQVDIDLDGLAPDSPKSFMELARAGLGKVAQAMPGVGRPSFVETFGAHLPQGAKAESGFERGYQLGLAGANLFNKACAGTARFVDSLDPAKMRAAAGRAIDKANNATDRAEVAIKETVASARGSVAEGVRSVLTSGAVAADAATAKFEGKVGQLKTASFASLGQVVLRVQDALPGEEQMLKSGQERQAKLVKAASIGGALLVGVCLASVAMPALGLVGVLAATAGGAFAGMGAHSGLGKGMEKAREFASVIPSVLESIAERLGVKRAQKAELAEAPKVQPLVM